MCALRIAIVADIHGNLPALEAVLADVKQWSPDQLIVAGDMVGPDSRAVFDLLATVDHLAIRGNHEELLLDLEEPTNAAAEAPIFQLLRFAREELGEQWVQYIRDLPDHFYLSLQDPHRLCVAHGIPGDTWKTFIWPEAREHTVSSYNELRTKFLTTEEAKQLKATMQATLFVTAHSHSQFVRSDPVMPILNPGAVRGEYTICGTDVLAEYAVCDWLPFQGGIYAWSYTFRQIPFDAHRLLQRLQQQQQKCEAIQSVITYYTERVSNYRKFQERCRRRTQ